jgi:hypothetical protein
MQILSLVPCFPGNKAPYTFTEVAICESPFILTLFTRFIPRISKLDATIIDQPIPSLYKMLSKSLLAFLLAPVCLGIGIRERYATFHTSTSRHSVCRIPLTIGDDCSDPADPNYENFNMDSNACIDQQGRHSLMPGKKATTAGVYCFVYYEEDNCNCIKGARKIHPSWKDDPSCETKEVAGYKSYHFEHAKHVSHL